MLSAQPVIIIISTYVCYGRVRYRRWFFTTVDMTGGCVLCFAASIVLRLFFHWYGVLRLSPLVDESSLSLRQVLVVVLSHFFHWCFHWLEVVVGIHLVGIEIEQLLMLRS